MAEGKKICKIHGNCTLGLKGEAIITIKVSAIYKKKSLSYSWTSSTQTAGMIVITI